MDELLLNQGQEGDRFPVLMAKIDSVFSEFVRTRDTNNMDQGYCISCRRRLQYNQLQCGHFYSRRFLSTRWDEYNAHAQCHYCNVFKDGNLDAYKQVLIDKYGSRVLQYLEAKHVSVVHWNRTDLEEILEYFKTCINQFKLIKRRGGSIPIEFFKLPPDDSIDFNKAVDGVIFRLPGV